MIVSDFKADRSNEGAINKTHNVVLQTGETFGIQKKKKIFKYVDVACQSVPIGS